jgi:curli biogenesis system outer membrane secretion channel CsgG
MRLALLALLLTACAGTRVLEDGGRGIDAVRSLDAHSLPRIAVGGILDKTGPQLLGELVRSRAGDGLPEAELQAQFTAGLRDMLTSALFDSGQFIVLEREALPTVLLEQALGEDGRLDPQTTLPAGALEGAQLLVVGAITAFDADAGGGALPIPIPLGNGGDFGVLHLRARRGHVALDLRVIEIASGRVLRATAVEGRNWRLALDLTGYFSTGSSSVKLPGLLRYFQNTPVQAALQKMVAAAVREIAAAAQEQPPAAVPATDGAGAAAQYLTEQP